MATKYEKTQTPNHKKKQQKKTLYKRKRVASGARRQTSEREKYALDYEILSLSMISHLSMWVVDV